MKKSYLAAAILLGALLCVTGCASTDAFSSEKDSPAAIISVTGTNLVVWQEKNLNDNDENDGTDGVLSSLVNKIIDKNNPEIATAVDRLDYADESFRHILPEIAGIQVISKDKVVDSEIYKYSRGSFYNSLSDSTQGTDYKDMTLIGAKKARMFLNEFGAKSLVAMDFTFRKVLAGGTKQNGQAAALVLMKIKVLNSRGKEIVNKVYTRQSEQTTAIKSGYYDKNELLSLINSAVDDAITAFALEYSDGSFQTEKPNGSAAENLQNNAGTEASAKASTTDGTEQETAVSVPATKLGKPKTVSKELSPEEAAERKAEETAENLLKMGLEPEKIAEATGLSVEKIKEIDGSIKNQNLGKQGD